MAIILVFLLLTLLGCGEDVPVLEREGFLPDQLQFTDKPCPILDYFTIERAWCSDGEIYVYNKKTRLYHHVKIHMAVY